MINIIQNTNNNIVVTLKEKQQYDTSYFLFEFTNDTTGEVKYFTATDLSLFPCSYNQFTITESSVEDLYDGIVTLTPTGFWSYVVYEMPDASPITLDPNDEIGILEVGKVFVTGTTTVNPTFTLDDTIDNPVFNEQ